MFSAIPRTMLPHTATLKRATGIDENLNKTYAATVTLNFVRFEPAKKTALTSLGEQRDDKMVLFFDCLNSLPFGQTFEQLDEIEFNGIKLSIREVNPEYTVYGTPHHYEIYLS